MTKLLLILGVTIALPCLILCADPKCHTSEIWHCLDIGIEWFTSLPKQSIPTTEPEVEHMCSELEKAFVCAHKWLDNCLTPMQKEVLDLSVEGIEEFRYQFCKKGSPQREKYLAHVSCIADVLKKDEVKDAMEYYVAVLEKLPEIDNTKKLTYGCCGYAKGYNKVLSMISSNCDEATLESHKDFVKMIFAQGPDVLCNGFTGDEDRCVALLPPEGTKPTDTLKGTAMYNYVKNALKNWID